MSEAGEWIDHNKIDFVRGHTVLKLLWSLFHEFNFFYQIIISIYIRACLWVCVCAAASGELETEE